jgi:hypothetical protein
MIAKKFKNDTLSNRGRDFCQILTTDGVYGIMAYLRVHTLLCLALQPFVGPWPIFQFSDLLHGRWDSLDGGSDHRKAATYTQGNKQNKRTQIPMPRVRFEPTIPVFERAKTVPALDRAATAIDRCCSGNGNMKRIATSPVLCPRFSKLTQIRFWDYPEFNSSWAQLLSHKYDT